MVRRLIEDKAAASPEEARLIELIEADPPVVVSEATQQRVLAGVSMRAPKRRLGGSRLLRPSVVFGVLLLLVSATAAATLGRRWIERRAATVDRATPETLRAPRPRSERVIGLPAPAPAAAEIEAEPPIAQTPPGRPAHARSVKREDPSRVVAAVQALRKNHDAGRAARLLDEYLRTYPHGALAEEALALSIEAAADLHSPALTAFAERYLREYPKGRFRRAAEQALAPPR
jgi:hypothetical protein